MAQFSLFPTSLGECAIAWDQDLIVGTHLPERTSAATAQRLASRARANEGKPPPHAQKAIASITALLEGEKIDLTYIACDFSQLEKFAAKVYAATRAIPVGQTLTYGDIASKLGNKQFAQNVGRTLGRNPLPIIVPCHRVLGANAKLTGFSAYGGIETKLKMLAIEGARVGDEPGLFDDL